MSSDPDKERILGPGQFTVDVRCHWCGHKGMSLWEDANGFRQIVSMEGFYERLGRKLPFHIETVCNNCGKAQPI